MQKEKLFSSEKIKWLELFKIYDREKRKMYIENFERHKLQKIYYNNSKDHFLSILFVNKKKLFHRAWDFNKINFPEKDLSINSDLRFFRSYELNQCSSKERSSITASIQTIRLFRSYELIKGGRKYSISRAMITAMYG